MELCISHGRTPPNPISRNGGPELYRKYISISLFPFPTHPPPCLGLPTRCLGMARAVMMETKKRTEQVTQACNQAYCQQQEARGCGRAGGRAVLGSALSPSYRLLAGSALARHNLFPVPSAGLQRGPAWL